MATANTAALLINGLAPVLTLFLLILILWQDSRNAVNLSFGLLMVMVVIWASGMLLGRITAYMGSLGSLTDWGIRLLRIGFTGSCLGIYLFAVVISGGQGWRFLRIAGIGIALVLLYQIALTLVTEIPAFEVQPDGTLRYAFGSGATLIYIGFIGLAVALAWQRRHKIRDRGLLEGVTLFCLGMLIELISPEFRNKSIGADLSSLAVLLIGYALVRAQIIDPLAGRASQLRAVRDVGVAITSRVRLPEVLSTIAAQAAGILKANGAAIFLVQDGLLELAAVHNMPPAFLGYRLMMGQGLAGRTASLRQSIRVEDYHRDWKGQPDMPFAKESFGSMIAAPLVFADEVMGVLVVIEGRQSKRFDREDMRLIDLLGPQAAVAITNSRLFEKQRALTGELESSRNHLETVLISTENPVVALNRRLEVIFANPAATALVDGAAVVGRSILTIAPAGVMPPDPAQALHSLYRRRVFVYELTLHDRTYLCHLGLLGRPRPQGFVAVLNDVSQLKELDRMKNQMIRMTSHDLKNPLSAAMFHVELLQEEGEGIFTQEMRDDIVTIWTQLQRMNRITRGILDLERVQSGTLTYEECAIEQIITLAAHEYEEQIAQKGLTLQIDLPTCLPPITGDHQQLTQAVSNLIENAVKFTMPGGSIQIKVECLESEIVIHIIDTGIGIPAEAQAHVFDRFFRAYHPGMEQISGSGLGLSLVKAVVDAHKGRIWLESTVNQGTAMHMAVPVRQAAPADMRKS